MDIESAASLLGMPAADIVGVEDDPRGTLISTVDGQAYLLVPEDAPDFDGKAGLMFARKPVPSYAGAFPVWADDPDRAPAAPETPAQPEREASEPIEADAVPVGSAKDVLAWVGDDPGRAQEAHDAEEGSESPRKGLLASLAKLIEGE